MLGTPQLATDSSQAVAWQATYEPFGQASVSGTVTQNLRFPGQYFDVESGWNHNGFRNYLPDLGRYMEPDPLGMQGSGSLYNPATGRFLSEDPIGFAGGQTNLYAYVGNDPIDFTDPFGLRALTACEKQRLSPFIPKVDLDNADLHDGEVPWYLGKDFEGITRGNNIYFRPGVL